jgi:hypothetical protein
MKTLLGASRLAQFLVAGVIVGWVGFASAQIPGSLPIPPVDPVQQLPEPGTLALLGAGLVGLAGAGWRRSRRK